MRGRAFVVQTIALLCVLIVVTVYSPYDPVTLMAWGAAALYWEPVMHGFSNRKHEESQARYDAFASAKKTNDLIDRGKK